MATIPDSVKATLDAQWTGAGGTEPTYYVKEDYNTYNMPPAGQDYIWIDTTSHKKTPRPVNDTYANITNTIDIYVNTLTSADRRKEIADEVVRILNGTAITGVNLQWTSDRTPVRPDKIRGQHMEKIQVTMLELLVSSGSAYGAGVTSTLLTALQALTMYGAANAAWVPCAFEGGNVQADYEINVTGTITNTGAGAMGLIFTLPYPPTKGSLKLYVSGTEVGLDDADASNFVTAVYVLGITFDTQAVIDVVGTNLTTIAAHQDTFTAVDCSSYDKVIVNVECTNPNAGNLDISYVTIRCYYA